MGVILTRNREPDLLAPFDFPTQPLDTVTSRYCTLSLLRTAPDWEVIQIDLRAGGRIFVEPSPYKESYLIYKGRIEFTSSKGTRQVSAPEVLNFYQPQECMTLSALSDATIIFYSNQPQWAVISGQVDELRTLAVTLEEKDGYTSEHCGRLQTFSYATGKILGLDALRMQHLDIAAFFHDLGKLCVPLSILQKPAKLTDEEWLVIKQHPSYGKDLLIKTQLYEGGAIVEQHHERMDGSGYPYGLHKSEIAVEAYIIACADTYDAMTSNRPYRAGLPHEVAVAELQRFANIHYPKEVVAAFLQALEGELKQPPSR